MGGGETKNQPHSKMNPWTAAMTLQTLQKLKQWSLYLKQPVSWSQDKTVVFRVPRCVISALTPSPKDTTLLTSPLTLKLLKFCTLCNCWLTKKMSYEDFSTPRRACISCKLTVLHQLVKETSWCYTCSKYISWIVTDSRFYSKKQQHCLIVTTPVNCADLSVLLITLKSNPNFPYSKNRFKYLSTDKVFSADRRMHTQ